MTAIKINNDFSYLYTKDNSVREKLYRLLRFRQRNYFHTSLYKQKKWDGFINFFNKDNGKFLTGLLPEVTLALKHWGIEWETLDERKKANFICEKVDDQWLNDILPEGMKPVTLEDYQVDLINQAIKYGRGIVKSPTASGKTYIMLGILKALPPGTPVLFLGNRKGVVRQNYKELIKWGFKNVGRFDGDVHEPNIITCATVQSLHHLEKLLPKFKAVIVDEIHMVMSAKAIKIYKKLTGCSVRIAVSATPFKYELKKKDKKSIEGDKVHKYSVKGYFGPVFKTQATETGELTTEFLQDRGRLSGSKCTFFSVNEPKIQHDIYIDAVTNGIAQNWGFHQTVKKLAENVRGRTLIMVERLAHGDALHQLIPNSLWVQGKDNNETRDYVIDQLQKSKGDIIAIATSGIFTAAINVFIHNYINAAGGKAAHDIIQRIGRGLRPADDKEILRYFDFIFKINPYLEDHSMERIKVLSAEGHEIEILESLDQWLSNYITS